MAPENEAASAGRELAVRLNEKIQHVNEMIEQKLDYQGKITDSRLEGMEKTSAEKLLGFSIRLEEALQEIRGYKDILQQQLTLLDSAIKKAHSRMDDMDAKGTTKGMSELIAVRKELQDGLHELETIVNNVQKLEEVQHDKEVEETTRKNDPIRKFFVENGKRILMFVLLGVGLLVLKNLPDLLNILNKLGEKAGGG
jgi:hypothetical protein